MKALSSSSQVWLGNLLCLFRFYALAGAQTQSSLVLITKVTTNVDGIIWTAVWSSWLPVPPGTTATSSLGSTSVQPSATGPAAIVPVEVTTTDGQGRTVVQTSEVLSEVTATILTTITSVGTNDAGGLFTSLSTEARPAVIKTTTDPQGIVATITIAGNYAPTPGEVLTTTNAQGSTFLTTYTSGGGRMSSVKLITTTDAEGRPQTLASVTLVDPTQVVVSASGGSTLGSATSSATTSSASATTPSPGLSTAAAVGIAIGATLAVVGLAVGAYLLWRRRRKRAGQSLTRSETERETQQEKVDPYVKAEMHATDRALYELDGRGEVPEADGVGRLADGELEDEHASGVAREREGRNELPGRTRSVASR